MKLFLKDPEEMESALAVVIEQSTKFTENPDIRDRGYIYWRLLSEYAEETKEIVLSDKPTLKGKRQRFEESLLDNLVDHVSMVSSVYHKSPQTIFKKISYSKR